MTARVLLAEAKITCEAGHAICETAKDIRTDMPADATAYINYAVGENGPQIGSPEGNYSCCKCGARWMRLDPRATSRSATAIQIHTINGWWP